MVLIITHNIDSESNSQPLKAMALAAVGVNHYT